MNEEHDDGSCPRRKKTFVEGEDFFNTVFRKIRDKRAHSCDKTSGCSSEINQ